MSTPNTDEMLARIMARLDEIENAVAHPVPSFAVGEAVDAVIVDVPAAVDVAPHNDLVEIRVLTLFHYDGDPATDGIETYAPEGFEFSDEQLEGLAASGLSENEIAFLPDTLTVTRIVADALVKAGIASL